MIEGIRYDDVVLLTCNSKCAINPLRIEEIIKNNPHLNEVNNATELIVVSWAKRFLETAVMENDGICDRPFFSELLINYSE
jgi:hypothetical protein